jgi:hypothetical protein
MKVKADGQNWGRNEDYVLARLTMVLGWNDNNRIMMSPLWQKIQELECDADVSNMSIGSAVDSFINMEYQSDFGTNSTTIISKKLNLK